MCKIYLLSILLLLSLNPITSQHIRLPLYKNYFAAPNASVDPNNGFLDEETTTLAIDNVDNAYYTVNVSLGSAQLPYSLVVDTLAFFVWVTTSDLQSNDSRHHFDCNSSTTCNESNLLFPIYYTNGSMVQGSVITDTLYLGDANVTQKMVVVNNTISIIDFPADGQLGIGPRYSVLGFSVGPDTVIENAQSQGAIAHQSFAVYLCNNSADVNSSELILGGFDSARMEPGSNFSFYPLVKNDALGIALSTVGFGTANFSTSETVMFDTRASAIVAARDDFDSLLTIVQVVDSSCASQDIGGLTVIACDCSTNSSKAASYPELNLMFAGDNMTYTIRPEQYVYMDQNGSCVLDVSKASLLANSWSVGHQFMKNYYTYYDMDQGRIGIAPVVQNC